MNARMVSRETNALNAALLKHYTVKHVTVSQVLA